MTLEVTAERVRALKLYEYASLRLVAAQRWTHSTDLTPSTSIHTAGWITVAAKLISRKLCG